MEYFGMVPGQSSRISQITKWGVAAVAVFMGIRGVQAGLWYYIPLALILIVFAFFRKEHVISKQGVDVRRVFIVYKTHSVWPWNEVTRILVDYETMKPLAMLLISRGRQTRQFMMKAEDAKAAVALGRDLNPDIITETQDASGRHREYNYNRGTGTKYSAAAKETPVQQPESFQDVKEELRRQKERAEQLKQYRRPDPKTARKCRPEKKLQNFH